MVVQVCNPTAQEGEAGKLLPKASLGYIVGYYLTHPGAADYRLLQSICLACARPRVPPMGCRGNER